METKVQDTESDAGPGMGYEHWDRAGRGDAGIVTVRMTPVEALQAATLVNAQLFGLDDRVAFEERLLADIVAPAGNPLHDIGIRRLTP